MRRSRSILLFIAATIALLALVFWIKSYFRSDTICWDDGRSPRTQRAIQSRRGRIVFGRLGYVPKQRYWKLGPMSSDVTGSVWYRAGALPLDWIGPTDDDWSRLGFAWRRTIAGFGSPGASGNPAKRDELTIVSAPHWAIALPLAIWPVIVFRRWRQIRQRKRAGLCLHCGYELRGITSDRCPECGTSVDGLAPSRVGARGPEQTNVVG